MTRMNLDGLGVFHYKRFNALLISAFVKIESGSKIFNCTEQYYIFTFVVLPNKILSAKFLVFL